MADLSGLLSIPFRILGIAMEGVFACCATDHVAARVLGGDRR